MKAQIIKLNHGGYKWRIKFDTKDNSIFNCLESIREHYTKQEARQALKDYIQRKSYSA